MMPTLTVELKQLGGNPQIALSKTDEKSASRLLFGRGRVEAVRLIPLIFNLCPAAQTAAAAAALGLPLGTEYNHRIAFETLREHAIVMLREWPVALDRQPDIIAMTGLGRHFSLERLDDLERLLFNGRSDLVLEDCEAWMIENDVGAAADLATVSLWPKAPGRITFEDDPTFIGRVIHHPSLKRIIDREGMTLFARMAARVTEAAALISELRSGNITVRHGEIGDGQGWAEAARGRLTHSASLRAGLIESYSITTPTDRMTDGAFLEALLNSAATAPHAIRRQQMAVAMTCSDPCMPVVWNDEALHDA